MYLSAREWGIQPSEFWEMTPGEWLLEAQDRWLASDEGQLEMKKRAWKQDAELSRDEWMRKYGLA
jgi:hypothetical protein